MILFYSYSFSPLGKSTFVFSVDKVMYCILARFNLFSVSRHLFSYFLVFYWYIQTWGTLFRSFHILSEYNDALLIVLEKLTF